MGNFKNVDEFAAARAKFFESHPDAPVAENVECLNLVMKREYAEQILAGTKKLEFREYKPFYIKKLIDNDVADYIQEHIDDDDVMMFCHDIRQVQKIHFYNYNRSWFLDVEVTFNDAFCINKHDIEFLQKEYGCHDFDDDLDFYEKNNIKQRPYLFYFVIGKVLGTDLETKPKEEKSVGFCGGNIIKEKPIPVKDSKGASKMDIITFKVSKDVFNSIVNGKQGAFEKEIKPNKVSLYFKTDEKGNVIFINGVPQFRRYDAIQFTNKENSYTCLINNADLLFLDGEDMISYSELEDEEFDCTEGVISYALGEELK